MRKRLFRLSAFCAILLCLASGYVFLDRWQRTAIFSVELGESRWWREPPQGTEIFHIGLDNNEHIQAWYVPAADANAPTILYLHGSRWNLNSSVFRIERWADMGYAILAIDYRGFGQSSQRLPSQTSAVEDASAALQELARRQPQPERRFVYGHSLGAAVAVALAAQQDQPDFNGLIIESAFTRIRDLIPHSKWSHIPGLSWLVTQPFDSLTAIESIANPLLILHGTNDRIIPQEMAVELFRAAGRSSGISPEMVQIEGGSHSNSSAHPEYRSAVRAFIDKAASWPIIDPNPGSHPPSRIELDPKGENPR